MRYLIVILVAVTCAFAAQADEGMWTVDNFPADQVRSKHDVDITPQWLERVRLGVVRLAYCTASFVSPQGLILTNHHCVARCLAEHSSRERSLLETGFIATGREQEVRCGTQVADVLVDIQDVTQKLLAATAGMGDADANAARKQTLTQLEQDCEAASSKARAPLKCEAVTLYGGGRYSIYKYQRYDDVRLVFAPELAIAAFGGDPDNFQFPRWCLDMGLLRAYENGKPAATPRHLRIDFAGPRAGQPVFVAGHPGSTERLLTVAQLKSVRQSDLPQQLLRASELRGRYIQFAASGAEQERIVRVPLNGLENRLKIGRKQLDVLLDDTLMTEKLREEAQLRSKQLDDPWAKIERAQIAKQTIGPLYALLENNGSFDSRLLRYARLLTRAAGERNKPSVQRLREYTDAALPRVEQEVRANVPMYAELEEMTLSLWLERMREWLGHDHPVVRSALGAQSPQSLAAALVAGSKLGDPAARIALWEGGAQAIDSSSDPVIKLALMLEPQARAVRKRFEDEVEAPVGIAGEAIAKARFAALGTRVYPDATFTLRINFGAVEGWTEGGTTVEPFTRLARLFERADGRAPFALPPKWLEAKEQLDPNTPFNLATTNDIVGGNSGSPLIDAKGDIVGLIFDGNIHSIGNTYRFDAARSRGVAVHPAIIREALTTVYRATALAKELRIGR